MNIFRCAAPLIYDYLKFATNITVRCTLITVRVISYFINNYK